MQRPDLGVYVAVISSGRPGNVPAMAALVGEATWFVGVGEAPAYRAAGAPGVVEAGALCRARNAALQAAWRGKAPLPCVQSSDDLRRVERAFAPPRGKCVAEPSTFAEAVNIIVARARNVGAKLAGVAPTSNPFYSRPEAPVRTAAFIVGDFCVVWPSVPRWDERLRLKEDYDFTLQHLAAYGRVARCDQVLVTFAHRTNAGGAVAVRTPQVEQQAIAYLRAKWGSDVVRDNPRRPNEILLRLGHRPLVARPVPPREVAAGDPEPWPGGGR